MTKADYYRKRHRALMEKAKQEESWPETLLVFGMMLTSCAFIVTAMILYVPEM